MSHNCSCEVLLGLSVFSRSYTLLVGDVITGGLDGKALQTVMVNVKVAS